MAAFGRKKNSDTEEKKPKITKESLKKSLRLFRFVKPYLGVFSIGLLFLFLSSLTSMAFPYLTGQLVDAANTEVLGQINDIALLLLGVFFANAVFSYFRIYTFAIVTQKTLAALRQTTYNHLLHLQMVFFSERRIGELNSRISSDVALLQETLTTTIAEFIRQVMIIVIGIALLTFISGKLTLLMLALVPVVVIVAVIFGKFIRKLSKEAQAKVAESNTIVEETLQGISTVKAFVNERFEMLRYKKKTDEVIGVSLRGAKWRGAFVSFIIFCLFGSIVAVIWYGVILVQAGEMSMGDLFTFVLYSVFVGTSLGGIADIYSQLQKAVGATEHLMDILDQIPEENRKTTKNPTINKGELEFKKVSFSYPNRPDVQVLDDISFKVSDGQKIAIVGPSGAGKTTLTQLIMKFYQPTEGEIFIDNSAISEFGFHDLRKNIAIVPQDVLLFGGSIKENIRYGKIDATDEEIVLAAKQANAHEFIESFPEKYETLVGERGIQLSGGQRQRIAIARAILKDPKILILDEATSSLDSQSEKLVQEALEELMKNRTSLVIAHRLSTIRNADKILVFDKGKLKEIGSHDELAEREGGIYSGLNALQMKS